MPAQFPARLAATAEARWVGLEEADIEAMWLRMVESRAEVMAIFG